MKIYAGMIAYNEEWIIRCSLNSIYEYVDEIIVIDGSPWGASTDKTAEIARSIGPKVRVFSGKFENPNDLDHEKIQRQAMLDKMEKGKDNWCVLVDADEVWDNENLARLRDYLRHIDGRTRIIAYPHIQFVKDCWYYHLRKDKSRYNKKQYCCEPKPHNTLRLLPGIKYFNYHTVGVTTNSMDFRTELHVISFNHYSWAVPRENFFYRMYWRYLFIQRRKKEDWPEYRERIVMPKWDHIQNLEGRDEFNVLPYDGPQPKAIQPLIDTIWKR